MSSGTNQTNSKHTLSTVVESVFFAAGAVATLIALVQFYGGALTMFLLGVGVILAAVHLVVRTSEFNWRKPQLSVKNGIVLSVILLGLVLIVGGIVAGWCGWMRVSFGRASFTEEKFALALAKVGTAASEFGVTPGSTQSGDLLKQDENGKQIWIRWMIDPFLAPVKDFDGKEVHTSLVYIESVPFEDNYDSFSAWLEVDATATKMGSVVAFLVDEGSQGIWYKPRFRQMEVVRVGENDSTPLVYVDRPNKGETLVMFLAVANKSNQSELPDLRQCFPNRHHLEVK